MLAKTSGSTHEELTYGSDNDTFSKPMECALIMYNKVIPSDIDAQCSKCIWDDGFSGLKFDN